MVDAPITTHGPIRPICHSCHRFFAYFVSFFFFFFFFFFLLFFFFFFSLLMFAYWLAMRDAMSPRDARHHADFQRAARAMMRAKMHPPRQPRCRVCAQDVAYIICLRLFTLACLIPRCHLPCCLFFFAFISAVGAQRALCVTCNIVLLYAMTTPQLLRKR